MSEIVDCECDAQWLMHAHIHKHTHTHTHTHTHVQWGSATWKLHTWQKVLTVRHVHQMGFHVLSSDLGA
jgi:hypothetical protein